MSIKSRALLDKVRKANLGNELLWVDAVGREEPLKLDLCKTLSRGLQECATSGLLWSMVVWQCGLNPAHRERRKGLIL